MTKSFNLSQVVDSTGATNVGYTAPFTGAVARTQSSKNAESVSVLDFTGVDPTGATDSTAGIQAALAYINSTKASLKVPAGTYVCSGQLSIASAQGLRIVGDTSNNQLTGGSTIKYTGTASPFITVTGSSASISLENLNFLYSNSGFTGTLLTLPVNQLYLTNCMLGGVSLTTSQYLLDINLSVDVNINHTMFGGSQYAISGQKSDGTGFANVVSIQQCQFSGQSVGSIRNPGQSWAITGCDFENLTGGTGSAVYMDSACQSYGLFINGCWFGDATGAVSAYNWILWQGSGLVVQGNYFNGTGTNVPDAVHLLGTSYGVTVQGNFFSHFANAVNLGSYISNGTSISGNRYFACTNAISGTPVSDHFSYQSGQYTPTVSGLTVTGTPTYTGFYEKRGTFVYFSIVISTTGTTASTAGTTLFSLPFAIASGSGSYGTCVVASPSTALGMGTGFVGAVGIAPPTWSATANAIVITGSYQSSVL
jgi:hypothetical protein